MSRLVLVDAYNAIYRLFPQVPEDRDASRRLLVHRVHEVLGRGDAGGLGRVHLVFDTWPGAERAGLHGREGRISWHYARGSADDEILDHLRRHEGRDGRLRALVVTNDRELRGRARQLGARGESVDHFFRQQAPRGPRGGGLREPGGPPLRASDFGLPEGDIDLDDPGEDLL